MLLPLAGGAVEVVSYPLPPAVSPLYPLAGETFRAAAVVLRPGDGSPEEVVDFSAALLHNQELNLSSLVVFFLLRPHPPGRFTPRSVRYKHWHMVAASTEPVLLTARSLDLLRHCRASHHDQAVCRRLPVVLVPDLVFLHP